MGVAAFVGTQLIGMYNSRRALEEQAKANVEQARNIILAMNYEFQTKEQERYDAFESTLAELEKIAHQGQRLESMVKSSVLENLAGGGRTAQLLMRSVEADTNRAISSTKYNYKKRSNEIDLNKEMTYLNAKTQISGIKQVKKPNFLETALELYNIYQGATDMMKANTSGPHQNTEYKSQYDTVKDYKHFDINKSYKFNFNPPNPYHHIMGFGGSSQSPYRIG